MRVGYLDCFSGVAGDMWVGALLDAGLGLDLPTLRAAVASMGLPGVGVEAESVMRGGLAGTHFRVIVPPHHHPPHRHLDDILAILERADLPSPARDHAVAVFRALAAVEARVHAQSIEQVHFHEVGAEDTIVDIVCACLGVHLLGLERLYSSAVVTGGGTVECAHGTMPVPAPGTLGNLLGVPIRSGGGPGERTTPTGAALLEVLVDEFEPEITWIPEACGYGAGTRDDPGRPNLLRITIGSLREPGAATSLWELSCTLDTATGEQLGHLIEALLESGAVDAFAAPVHMKKGRPGYVVTALADDARRDDVARHLLEESSTHGVRMHAVRRQVLERWSEDVDTDLGVVACKAARLPSGRVTRRPEADEVARLVKQLGLGRAEVVARLAKQL